MKQLRYVDYDCPTCTATHTRFVYFDTDAHAPLEQEVCNENSNNYDGVTCDGVLAPRDMSGVGYMKTISKNNSDFNERERERLEKRQSAHWKREGMDSAIETERAFLRKMGVDGGVR
jgi:hypothetical protein